MKSWFLALESRERMTVLAGAGALLVMILYLAVWEPMTSGIERLETAVKEGRNTVQWMLHTSAEVQTLQKGSGNRPKGLGGRSMLSVVDQSARKSGLGSALKRVEPEGNDAVKVWLENASFDGLIQWLAQLGKQYGVDVRSITIERQETNGQVNSRVTLAEPSL